MFEVVSRTNARDKGLPRYFTGVPCKHGHHSERFVTSGGCVECNRASVRAYKADNRAALNSSQLARYRENRKECNAYSARWRKTNPSKVCAQRARRRAKQLKATLPGYEDQLREVYNNRPENMEVDHIIPLVHSLVCGLHVPWNLQYLTPDENKRKSNLFPYPPSPTS